MARVLAAWDEHLADPALPRRLSPLMRAAGFEDVHCEGHQFLTRELSLDTYGGALVGVVEHYVRGGGRVPSDELDAWVADQGDLGERGEFYFACVRSASRRR